MEYERQSVVLRSAGGRKVDLGVVPTGVGPSPLFSEGVASSAEEPWALHFRLSAQEYRNLKEIHSYTQNGQNRTGTRRAPRWRRDSWVAWPPEEGSERYLDFRLQESIERVRVGFAAPLNSKAYQRRFVSGELAPRCLVYIAGCGRSGTTLLQRLMRCFASTFVAQGERPFTAFLDLSKREESALVVKRDATAWQSLPWIPSGIKVIYCVRHPYDVLTSYHPGARKNGFYIKPSRWRAEYLALKGLLSNPLVETLIVRYEDLVGEPDRTQQLIEEFARLDINQRFSNVGEPLSNRSIRKWVGNQAFSDHLSRVVERHGPLLDEFMADFHYEP